MFLQDYIIIIEPQKVLAKKFFLEGLYFYILKLGGIEKLNYNTLINFPTFQYLYFKEFGYNPNPELLFILQSFTEFKLGLYEQALISYYNPGLNITKLVNFIFINWKSGNVKSSRFISFFETYSGKEAYLKISTSILSSANKQTSKKAATGNPTLCVLPEGLDQSNKFNFSLYYELCKFRNIKPMDIAELEWFVGFIERRCNESTRYDIKALTLLSKNKEFLFYVKNKLELS